MQKIKLNYVYLPLNIYQVWAAEWRFGFDQKMEGAEA